MLKFLRQNHKQIFIFISIAVAITFLISGVMVGDFGKKSQSSFAVGTIGGKTISSSDYLKSYDAVEHQAVLSYGERFKDVEKMLNLKGQAWDRLLLLDYAKKQNIKISDSQVVEWLSTQPAFSSNGNFDPRIYNTYVSYLRITPREFEEEVRAILAIRQIYQGLENQIKISDEELKKSYVEANSQKNLMLGVLRPVKKDDIKVEEKEYAQVYELVKNQLTAPERIKLSFLFVPKDKKASLKNIFLEKGVLMADLSKKYNIPLKETLPFSQNDAVPELGYAKEVLQAAFSSALNEESAWIESADGSYKIKVTQKEAGRPLTIDESKETLKSLLINQKVGEETLNKLREIKKKISSSDVFESTLKAEGVELKNIDSYKKGTNVLEFGPLEMLDRKISLLKTNEISDAFSLPDGSAVLVKVLSSSSGTLDQAAWDKEKDKFKKEATDKKLNEEVKSLLEKLRANSVMNSLDKLGLETLTNATSPS